MCAPLPGENIIYFYFLLPAKIKDLLFRLVTLWHILRHRYKTVIFQKMTPKRHPQSTTQKLKLHQTTFTSDFKLTCVKIFQRTFC